MTGVGGLSSRSAQMDLFAVSEVLQEEREQLLLLLGQMLEEGCLDLLDLADQLPDHRSSLLALGAHGCIDELRKLLKETLLLHRVLDVSLSAL